MNDGNGRPLGIKSTGVLDGGSRSKMRPMSDRYAELIELPMADSERRKRGLPAGATYGDALAMVVLSRALEARLMQSARFEKVLKARLRNERRRRKTAKSEFQSCT